MIGQGDYLQVQFNYTEGASLHLPDPELELGQDSRVERGFGVLSDAVVGGTLAGTDGACNDLQLTTAWNVNVAYEHFWNFRWRTHCTAAMRPSVTTQRQWRSLHMLANGNGTGSGTSAVATPGCDMDWSTWWLGSRTQWNVGKDFYMGSTFSTQVEQCVDSLNDLIPTMDHQRLAA